MGSFRMMVGLIFGLLLVGCGSETGQQDPLVAPPTSPKIEQIDGQPFGIIRGSLIATADSISGTGALIFRDPLIRKDNNFALKFLLPPNGTLTLAPNTEVGLAGKLAVVFSRSSTNKLIITLKDGPDSNELQGDMPSPDLLSANNEIFVEVDVHDHGHLTFWIVGQEESFGFNVRGLGKYWGLVLENCSVTSAKLLPPKDPH